MQQEARWLNEEIASMCDRADQADEVKDARYATDRRGGELDLVCVGAKLPRRRLIEFG